MDWASKATWFHQFISMNTHIPKREAFLDTLKNQFDYQYLEPISCEVELPASHSKVRLIVHNFTQCFYSLLNNPQAN
jgi:hypothetical protein